MFEFFAARQDAMSESGSSSADPSKPGNTSQGSRQDLAVPIRSLGENHRGRIASHLKTLDASDRYFRFGFAANDEQIQRYVDGLNFERDEIFGIYNSRLELIAMAHLAYSSDARLNACAEFGVSVLKPSRGRGFGARLFERAVMHARNQGVRMIFVHMLSENAPMLKIAHKAGAIVERDGTESEAHLMLPAATLGTHWTEMVEEHLAQANYQVKVHTKQIRDMFERLQSVWRSEGQGDDTGQA